MKIDGFDFSGWATRANMRCSDGRVIMKDAFKDCDGKSVPLVWGHRHDSPSSIIGHAILENREEGVYAFGFLNSTKSGQDAKALITHGDVTALSIYANNLKEQANNVIHGIIREVSLVLAGANPGAMIDSVVVHGDGSVDIDREQGVLYTGETLVLAHSDEEEDDDSMEEELAEVLAEELAHADRGEDNEEDADEGETLGDIYDTLTLKQKVMVQGMLEAAIGDVLAKEDTDDEEDDNSGNDNNHDKKEDDQSMKHNVFDTDAQNEVKVLSHSDGEEILRRAKEFGGRSLMAEMTSYMEENDKELAHADKGFNSISTLFPDPEDVRPGAPELLTSDLGWVTEVMNGVHKSPMSRLRTRMVDSRDISKHRALGYKKQAEKEDAGNLDIINRTTDPVTVYIRSKLDRDDIADITDFDVVDYMYQIDQQNLKAELARQIMIGDGRSGDEKAIDATKIRPIWLDDDTYTIHRDVDLEKIKESLNGTGTPENFGENYIYAEAVIEALLFAREKYRGSGNPVFFCTPHLVNMMLLARDMNGRRVYNNLSELTSALNVRKIVTVEQFENQTRKKDMKDKKLLGIMVNLADYTVGATKGGQLTHFTDFDINFNQQVSLLETRCSGALTRVCSAIALEEDITGKV